MNALWSHQCPSNLSKFDGVLLHLNWHMINLDDIAVFSRTPEEHLHRLKAVFDKLKAADLKLKPSKCDLFKQ